MYHKLLNSLFGLVVKSERCWASCLANQYLSSQGVQNVLIKNIEKNEDARLALFEGKLKEQLYEGDLLKSAVARLEAAFKSGQIDSGNYNTQLHKIGEIEKLIKMNSFNKHYKNEKDLREDCLRKLSQIGFDIDKSFYNTHKAELLAKEGPYGKVYNSRHKLHQSDKMLY